MTMSYSSIDILRGNGTMRNIGNTCSSRNLTVIARNVTDGHYYTGFITSGITREEGSHRVVFYNIQPQYVPTKHVINIGGAIPWPTLKIGDYVLVAVRCRTSGLECYLPGRVMGIPLDIRLENRFYTVKLYTGRMTSKPRRYIIKIGKDMYNDILGYIANVHYKKLVKYNSEPNLRKRLLGRGQRGISASGKKRDTQRATSAENINRKHKHHHHHYYHHFYDHPNKDRSRPTSIRSVPTSVTSDRTHSDIDVSPTSISTSTSTSTSTLVFTPISTPKRRPSSPKVPPPKQSTPEKGIIESMSRPLRRNPVKCNEEVLARWSDDGWYYFGIVTELDDGSVKVLDATGHVEWIRDEDILISEENHNETIQQYDKVIALHPRYVYSYAPATVLNVYQFGYRVQFYDDTERRLPESEVYKILPEKYTQDVKYIKNQELKMPGRVLARDDFSGLYRPFIAETPDHQTQQVFLQLPNNKYKKQMAIHVFSQDRSRRKFDRNWKYVLGPLDPACTIYLPAEIVSRRPLRLTFCNGHQNDHVKRKQCFYISEEYYKNATSYFFANNSNMVFN